MDTKTVGDIMLSLDECATIASDGTIRDALVALHKKQQGLTGKRHQRRTILVLDASGEVIGKLTHLGILRSLEPELLQRDDLASLDRAGLSADFIGRLSHLRRMFRGSLNQLCRSVVHVKVEDAMIPVRESISEDAPLSSAIRRLVALHAKSLLVHGSGKVVGILRLSDVFEEVSNHILEDASE